MGRSEKKKHATHTLWMYFCIVFLILFTTLPGCQSFPDLSFTSDLLQSAKGPDSSNNIVSIHIPNHDVTLSLNETINITLKIYAHSGDEKVNIYFDGGPEIEQLPNKTNVVITAHPQVFNVEVRGLEVGHCILHVYVTPSNNSMDVSEDYVGVNVRHSAFMDYIIDIVGWCYFVAWSVSFYPQIFLNFKNKSVIGLHFDFLSLNVIGFALYATFNIGLYWFSSIQEEYFQKHPYGVNPVQLNDVIFSIHALFACILLIVQCLIYDRGDQVVSRTGHTLIGSILMTVCISLVLSLATTITALNFLYILSYLKLFITLVKYIPQAYFNYLRKSTYGWSIGNIILDFTGGNLSILQMLLLSYNYNDWASVYGDPTKFGLGLASIAFDVLFMVQHYVLYNKFDSYNIIQTSYMNDDSIQSASYTSVESTNGHYGAV